MTHLVLVLVLTAAVHLAATCPAMCRCDSSRRLSVACTRFHDDLVGQLDKDVYHLTFGNLTQNQLIHLLEELVKLPHLNQLTVTHSTISDLATATANSTLVHVINSTFISKENATLKIFDLAGNAIAAVNNRPFRTLRNLEILNLSANSIAELNSDSFSELGSLKCLDLSNNSLTHLQDAVFLMLSNLQYLNLSRNRLRILNDRCLTTLAKLQQLDVSWNNLVHIDLGSLQLPGLARLMLTGNSELGTAHEPPLLVGTGQRLQTVDASLIGLQQVPAALTHSIRTLRLAGNSIKTVRCGDLDSYPLLQLLDFKSNGLEQIEDDALGRLDCLSILYLTDNNLKEVPRSLSEKLKVLHLEHNRISKVGNKDFQGLEVMEVLLLNDNTIRVVEEAAFSQLISLVSLDLSRNPIKILQAGCLSGPTTLQVLRLSKIAAASPAQDASFPLSSTEHLVTLDLSGSPGLARQLLSDTAALAASKELQELDMSGTDLDFVRSDLLHFLPQLRMFRVDGNPINCTELQWLAAWMRRQDQPLYREVTCASPPELWGTLLIDLQDAEIPPVYPSTTIPTTAGAAANEAQIKESTIDPQNRTPLRPTTPAEIQLATQVSGGALTNHSQEVLNLAAALGGKGDKNNRLRAVAQTTHKGVAAGTMNESQKLSNITLTVGTDKPRQPTKASPNERGGEIAFLHEAAAVNDSQHIVPVGTTETGENNGTAMILTGAADTTPNETQSYDVHANEVPVTEVTNNKLSISQKTISPVAVETQLTNDGLEVAAAAAAVAAAVDSHSSHDSPTTRHGVLILAAATVGVAVALIVLAASWRRRRRGTPIRLEETEEGLPGVTELW